MRFKAMDQFPWREGVPYLVLRHGNDAADFLVQQVQVFEGHLYPDALDFCVDWDDRVEDAVGWLPLDGIIAPETIEA